jgi:hypothetical protein
MKKKVVKAQMQPVVREKEEELMKKKTNKRSRSTPKKKRRIMGVTANLKNVLISVALLFGFVSGIFQIYSWIDTTYAKAKWVKVVELKGDIERENSLLNTMYARFCTLDNMFMLAPDPTKVDPELRKEWIALKGTESQTGKIRKQEDKVKLLETELQICGRVK